MSVNEAQVFSAAEAQVFSAASLRPPSRIALDITGISLCRVERRCSIEWESFKSFERLTLCRQHVQEKKAKLDVQFSRIQLSRRRYPLCGDGRDQRNKINKPEIRRFIFPATVLICADRAIQLGEPPQEAMRERMAITKR